MVPIPHHPTERDLVESLLGPHAASEPLASGRHRVTRWHAVDRAIVVKAHTGDATFAVERRVLEVLAREEQDFAPRLLATGPRLIAMAWIEGAPFLERFDPFDLAGSRAAFVAAAETIARLQRACSVIPQAELGDGTLDSIPGPRGFVHGDPLPHNLLVDAAGRVRVIDLEHGCWGHALLDLAPLACVSDAATREELLSCYCGVLGWQPSASIRAAFESVARRWPRALAMRLGEEPLRNVLRGAPGREALLRRWCSAGIAATP